MAWRNTRANRYILRFSGDHQKIFRSSRPEVFCRKGVLKSFTNSQESTCARVSFLIKLRAWGKPKVKVNTFNFITKRIWHRCFHVNFARFLRTAFLQNTSEWLLLTIAFDVCALPYYYYDQQHHGLVRKNVYLHGEEKRPL